MEKNLIYLDTYVLQQDMRIRLPKSILKNMNLEKGVSRFHIYYDKVNESLVLQAEKNQNTKKKVKITNNNIIDL